MNNQISKCYQKADKVEDLYESGHITKTQFLRMMKDIRREIDFIQSNNIQLATATHYFN
jgi:uncharacterized coiled-coil DUF342 family protein